MGWVLIMKKYDNLRNLHRTLKSEVETVRRALEHDRTVLNTTAEKFLDYGLDTKVVARLVKIREEALIETRNLMQNELTRITEKLEAIEDLL